VKLPPELQQIGDALSDPYGVERSVRISSGVVDANRYVLRLHRRFPRVADAIPAIARDFGLPEQAQAVFDAGLPKADSVYLGVGSATRRVYLSPPDGANYALAWKWNVETGEQVTGRYDLYPGVALSVPEMVDRVGAILDGHAWLKSAVEEFLVELKAPSYFESSEDDSPRVSFYANVYGAKVPIGKYRPLLDVFARHFEVEAGMVWDEIAQEELGLFSGGIGRDNAEYLAFYVGAHVVGSVPADWMVLSGLSTLPSDSTIVSAGVVR
jgi:hypothetical protein